MARQLNGSTQYLERTTAVVSSFPLSLSCWIYLASTTAEQLGLCLYNTTGLNNVQIDYPNSSIGWRAFAEQAGASSTSQYRSNVTGTIGWYGLAASWATYGQVPNFWINGAKVTGGSTFTGSGGTLTLSRTGVGTYLFLGTRYNTTAASRYAYCAIWNAELTDAEMKSLTQTTPRHPTFIRRASLQACWDFGGHFGENDLSRVNNNDLTPTASPTWAEQPPVIYPRVVNLPQRAAAATTNTLTVSNATLNLTGQSSSLILSRKLLVSNGSLNLAGQTSSLSLSRSLSTSKADLNISGQSSLLQVARLLSASNGTIEFSGQSADLRLSRNLSVNNASLSLSGQSTTIYAARSLTVDHADVNLSGQVVTLSAGKTLTVNNGEIQFVGQQVSLTTHRNLTIVNTDISLSGQSVSMKLTTQQNLTVSNAGIEVQGQQVTLRLAKSLVVLPAEIQSSGQTAQLTVARKLAVQNGDVDLAGQDVMVRRRFELGIGEGQVSFSGEGIGLLSSRKILATEGRVQFSGQAVQIYPTFQNPVQIFGGNLRFIDKTTGSLRFIQEITR